MKLPSLPEVVNTTLVWMGVWEKPSVALAVRNERQPFAAFSQVREGSKSSYDGDKEFIDTDNVGLRAWNGIEDEGVLIEGTVYLTNGRSYRLQRFREKSELVTMMKAADDGFDTLFEHGIAPPSKLREAVEPSTLEESAALVFERMADMLREGYSVQEAKAILREDNFVSDSNAAGSFSQDWITAPDPRAFYGSGSDPTAEYIPLMGGPWNKQLYLQQYLLQHAQAFEAYNHNPIAKQLIDLTTAFVFGRGVDFTCSNIEVDEILREFTERTDYFHRLEVMSNDMWWSGNCFKEWYDNDPEKGMTDFRAQDPSTIWEIVTDPEDIRKIYYYHQQYATPYQNLYSGAGLQDKAPKDIPVMKYIMRHIPADQIDHVKINCSEWEKYGRSDLFCILGWLKRLKDLLNARVVKGLLEAAFVWDFTLATDQGDVNSIALQLPDPFSPGSSFVHNKTIELKPQSTTMTHSGDTMPDVSELKSMIATGVGTPKEFIGETQRMSRTASLTTTEPGTKRYERRQQMVETMILSDFDHVIKVAAEAGEIDLEDILEDARSVRRLGDSENEIGSRADVVEDKEEIAAQADKDAAAQTAHQDAETQAAMTGQPPPKALPPPKRTINVTSQTRESFTVSKGNKPQLNDKQKRRIQTIIKTGRIARELCEVTFPSIAAEDRSAKLKDLALSEAMEWLPKSIVATLAAKELNITTYDFETIWRQIVQEAKAGMSLAHVYGQDNKHVPSVAQAQSVEEEETAMKPPDQQPFTQVPVPPNQAGFKIEPNKAAGGNGAPPGSKPNSGDTKVNNKAGMKPTNPTDPSARRSAAGSHPMTNEGKKNIAQKESDDPETLRGMIVMHLLREAVAPMTATHKAVAEYVLGGAREELEEALRNMVNNA